MPTSQPSLFSRIRGISILFLLVFLTTGSSARAQALSCDVCKKTITGKYLTVDGKIFCSQACYAKTLPRCAGCGRRISGRHIKVGGAYYCSEACYNRTLPLCNTCHRRIKGSHKVLDGKHFCSKRCLEAYLPKCERCNTPLYKSVIIGGHQFCPDCAKLPTCWKCHLPKPLTTELSDGRKFCRDCSIGMITRLQQADPLYMIARHEVKRVTGYTSPTIPGLHVVGQDVLKKYAPGHADINAVQWGVYRREVTMTTTRALFRKPTSEVTDVKENIYILGGLNRQEFIVTAAHEITHDLLAEQFPVVAAKAPGWVEEGLCQYVSAGVCILNAWYDELKPIENAPDHEYGDGYRYFKKKFGDADWEDVVNWIKHTDVAKLPSIPPNCGLTRK